MKKLITLFIILSTITFAQNSGVVEITVSENESIRDIAKKYLQNADYWEPLLKINNLSGPSQVKPGTLLKIPVKAFRDANQKLVEALNAITKASDVGAKLFAEELLSAAENKYNEGLDLRNDGELAAALNRASQSLIDAKNAESQALNNRSKKSTANLTDKKGNVENIKPAQTIWNELGVPGNLDEGDKVRTLSNSFAEITFEDENRIKLNSNAQALIQTMRVDLLEKKRESSVKIVEGDAFAFLSGSGAKKQFDVALDDVETKLNSKNFWVKKEDKKTKIANYDGYIEVSSAGETVVIGKNEKSTIEKGKVPSSVEKLLDAPTILSPLNNSTNSSEGLALEWGSNPEAVSYYIEVSSDKNFKQVVYHQSNYKNTSLNSLNLSNGIYFWRVSAIDRDQFPGVFSEINSFVVSPESNQTFLVVYSPEDEFITSENNIEISGKTEADAEISVNEIQVRTSETNEFQYSLELNPGRNEIIIKAVNPKGDESIIKRTVIYDSPKNLNLYFDNRLNKIGHNQFLFNTTYFTLSGTARPNALVTLNLGDKTNRVYSDASGKFGFNINQNTDSSFYHISFVTKSGLSYKDSLVVLIDSEAPIVKFSEPLQPVTNKTNLTVAGKLNEKARLTINGKNVDVSENELSFSQSLELESGENTVILKAMDDAGNVTSVSQKIKLDITPPELVDFTINTQRIGDVAAVSVRLKITDDSPVKNTARLKVLFGKDVKFYFLRYIASNQSYEGRIYNPSSEYSPRITSAIIEDYLGNKKEYQLTQ